MGNVSYIVFICDGCVCSILLFCNYGGVYCYEVGVYGSNNSRLHVEKPPKKKNFHLANWSQLIHSGPSSSRSSFLMESSQSCAATITHYSTGLLTTGPDYDPLLRLLSIAGDVHPNPGPPRYPCSVCFKNVTSQGTSYRCTSYSHWVNSRCSGLRNVADYHRANGWICTACMTPPPQPRTHSPPPPSPVLHVRQYVQHTTVERQWHRQQTDGTKHLPRGAQRQGAGHLGVQAHGKLEKSQYSELHSSTTGSTPRPKRSLTVFIHNLVSFNHKPLSTTSKNEPTYKN